MRHAHAAPAASGEVDHTRALDDRGIADAARIGRAVADAGFQIEAVACSDAVRTRQTLDGLRPALPAGCSETFDHGLYSEGIEGYWATIRRGAASSLLVVGHNPGIGEVARALCGQGDAGALKELAERFPTATLAVVDLPCPLASAEPGSGRLVRLIRPDKT